MRKNVKLVDLYENNACSSWVKFFNELFPKGIKNISDKVILNDYIKKINNNTLVWNPYNYDLSNISLKNKFLYASLYNILYYSGNYKQANKFSNKIDNAYLYPFSTTINQLIKIKNYYLKSFEKA
jgi:hypothetical protein